MRMPSAAAQKNIYDMTPEVAEMIPRIEFAKDYSKGPLDRTSK
jgi:hypothetical protein